MLQKQDSSIVKGIYSQIESPNERNIHQFLSRNSERYPGTICERYTRYVRDKVQTSRARRLRHRSHHVASILCEIFFVSSQKAEESLGFQSAASNGTRGFALLTAQGHNSAVWGTFSTLRKFRQRSKVQNLRLITHDGCFLSWISCQRNQRKSLGAEATSAHLL